MDPLKESDWKQLRHLMQRLRDPESGCPWDVAQTPETLVRHTIEEAYEVADAIERNEPGEVCDELGDLLFQVFFYARIYEESGRFSIDDVLDSICRKLIRRHPHVFADARFDGPGDLDRAWERIKSEERRDKQLQAGTEQEAGALSGITRALPALMRAEKLQRRAAQVGFEWPQLEQFIAKLDEEIGELKDEVAKWREPATEGDDESVRQSLRHELGDVLFSLGNLARFFDMDPEAVLQEANARFEGRFSAMERLSILDGTDFRSLNLEAKLRLWQQAKASTDDP